MKRILRAVDHHTSRGGLGFAGAAGLVASGLTDIASNLGPLLPWFSAVVALAALVLAVLIGRGETAGAAGPQPPGRVKVYCHLLVVALGSLFGTVVLLISGLFVEETSGSRILSVLDEIRSGVERVEQKVDAVGEGVVGLGERVGVRDISGRSGTGKIGDVAVFLVTLENERLMQGASCRLRLDDEWSDRIQVLDDSCAAFTVELPSAPLLDAGGNSLGEIVPVPFALDVLGSDDRIIASYEEAYPFHNNYRTIELALDPPGNRFSADETRKVRVDAGDAELPSGVECEWTLFEPMRFEPTSENRCAGILSTEVDKSSYAYRNLIEQGEIRDEIYVQVNVAADFTMLGNATFKYAVTP